LALATRLNTKVVLCHMVSVNDVICHGFPDKEPLEFGDIVANT
jgi:methionine aminopeptidase